MTLAGLEALEPIAALRVSRWAYPLVNAGHVLGIGLVVGAAVPLDLRHLGLWPSVPPETARRLLRPVAAAGILLALVTGAALFAVAAREYWGTTLFRVKMGLLGLALANAAATLIRPAARWQAAASLLLWLAVLLAGRFIAYL